MSVPLGPTARARRKKLLARRRRATSIYQQVDARDELTCRACVGWCGHRRQQHHIRMRSLGGLETVENLVTLCQFHHDEIHAHRLWIVGTDANAELRFSSAEMPMESE